MKYTNSLKVIAFCSAIALSSLGAAAQTANPSASPATTEYAGNQMTRERDTPNYSWIGLLGLLGLAGLMRKRHDERVHVPGGVRHT